MAAGQVGSSRAPSTGGGRAAAIRRADRAIGRGRDDGVHDRGEIREPPHAGLTGRQLACLGFDERVAEPAQPLDVGAGRRVGPHLAVHGRRDDDGRRGRETRGGHHVCRPARWPSRRASGPSPARPRSGLPSQRGRCARCDRRGAGRAASVSTGWRLSAANDSGPTNRVADGVSMACDVGALRAQEAEQLDRLVRSDRAGHPEPDEAPGQAPAGRHDRPSSSGSPPATSAWRIARPLRVKSGSIASTPSTSRAHGAAERPPVRITLTAPGSTAWLSPSSRRIRAKQSARQPEVAEHRPGLHRPDRVPPDRAVRDRELDPRQLRRPRGERLEAQLEAGRDRPADVGTVARHAIERRRGAEVHDHGRRPVQPLGGERIDQAVRADLRRPIHADRDRHGPGLGDDERPLATCRDCLDPAVSDGTTEAHAIALTSANDTSSSRSRPSSSSSSSSALARGGVIARRTATSDPALTSPIVTFELPMSIARSIARMIRVGPSRPCLRDGRLDCAGCMGCS